MRSYPTELAIALAEALITQGVAVYFFGLSQEIGSELPDAPPMLCNWIDKTPNVNALIAMIRQMDAMVCPDSFPMHLAGSLRIPTLAIFTSSPTRIVGGYTTINPITATAGCNPCGAIADQCPLHHPECIVPRQTDLHPETLAQQVMNLLQSSCKPHGGHCSPHPI